MKRNIFSLVTATSLLSFAVSSQAEVQHLSGGTKVQFNEVPPAVQQAIRAQAGAAEIEDIDRGTLNGQTVYEAAFKKDGQHTELRVGENGSVIDTIVAGQSVGAGTTTTATATTQQETQNQTSAATTTTATTQTAGRSGQNQLEFDEGFARDLSGARKITWEQVPANVQRIIKEKAGSAKIEDIDKGKIGQKVGYQAAYKKNGQHTELRVTEDGNFREVQGVRVLSSSSEHLEGFGRGLADAKRVTWQEVPQNVRRIVKERIGDSKVEHVRKGNMNDKTTYQISYNKNGKNGEIRVTEDGNFVKDVVAGKVIYDSAGSEK